MSTFPFSAVPATAPSASSALGSSIEAATEALLRARDEVISALDRQVVELQQLHSALASAPVVMEMPEEEPYTPSFLVPETELSPAAVASSLFAQAPVFSGPPLPPMMNEAPPPVPPMPVPMPMPQAAPPPMPPQAMPMPMPPMVAAQQILPPPAPQVAPPPAPPVQMPASPTPLPGLSWAAAPPPAFMPSLSSVAATFVPPQPAAPPVELFAPAMAAPVPPPAPAVPEMPMMAPPPMPPAMAMPPPAAPMPPVATQQKPGVTLPPPRGGITFTTFKAPPPAPIRQPLVPPPAAPPPMPAAAQAGGSPAFAPLPLVESKIDPTLERATLEELNEALASAFSTVSRK